MPNPRKGESKEDYISRFMSSTEAKKDYPDKDKRLAVAYSKWNQSKNKYKERLCLKGFDLKEEDDSTVITGLIATTHPDKVGDILSEQSIQQIVDYINDTEKVGGERGAYRSVSLFHDWIKEGDPTLDEVAFLKPTARKVQLPDGHYGVEVDAELNKFYKGKMTMEEIKYRIENGQIAGFSIEYDTDDNHSKTLNYDGKEYTFIESLTEFGGTGFARARMIANPNSVIYKEIINELKKKEESKMSEEEKVDDAPEQNPEAVEENKAPESQEGSKPAEDEEQKKEPESKEVEMKINFKELVAQVKEQALKEVGVESKIVKQTKESEKKMEAKEIPLSIKEMNESLKLRDGKIDILRFKEAVSTYFAENPELDLKLKEQYTSIGIPLRPTLRTKCVGNKLVIQGKLQMKATTDTTTNAGAYTETSVEFADLFIPGLIETFNNQANLFGALPKRDHLMGSNYYGWRIKTDQADSLAVDPDDPAVVKNPVDKLKLHTEIKEYRVGVSVSDYTLHHARASMGDLLMLEAEARMGDLMRNINNDLFAEVVDTAGNAVLGLEAVADSAGNTSIYGKTRSTANRLAPAAAGNTYTGVGGALTTAYLRAAITYVENEGAIRSNMRIVTAPEIRDDLFELEDGNQNYFNVPTFGFDGQISYDGIKVIIDSSCNSDDLYVVDFESEYIVISKGPQLVGLAKVGAAEEAYITVYLAHVYEQPRRIHMLQGLS